MTYEELKKIKISDVVKTSDLTDLSKTCLGIIKSSTIKDDEVILFINAAILDLKRQEIDAEKYIENELIKSAIIMYVKSNFGMVDLKEKELSQKRYDILCNNLALSPEYKIKEGVDENV